MDPIEKNISDTIKALKKDQVTGMSVANLFQVTPTKGVMCPVPMYRPEFERLAYIVAKRLKFDLYE